MRTTELNYGNFLRIARACHSINVSRLPRGFDFKKYLVHLLGLGSPNLAAWLNGLDTEDVEALKTEVTEFQHLVL